MFSLTFLLLSASSLYLAYDKDKKKQKKPKKQTKQQRLHKQFIQASKWAEEVQ